MEFGNLSKLLADTLALMAIMNPFGNLPIFIGMTEDLPKPLKKEIFKVIIYAGIGITLIFGIIGDFLMKYFFHLEINELRIAGGLLLIIVGLKNMLFSKDKKKLDGSSDYGKEEIEQGIIPMAFPLLVGPGAMATVLLIKREHGILNVIFATLVVFLIIKILFKFEELIAKIFGKVVLLILSRVMQLFIVAIGVSFMIHGIKSVF
ncbi:MarC family protein [Haliovirga abyssi]|uniref:UPF0056 membrane protein n=1 Tax=Haliovirga abyssi TaxID=2996794 RepID=A0AAU9DSN2_9FUSO|nr:MarC family protein [Haliovirga abyssi]BDU50064.1 UPF0056 inner membrane protein [Haliovirga abyssi]